MRRWLNQVVVAVAVKVEAVDLQASPVQRAGPLVVVELMPLQDVNDCLVGADAVFGQHLPTAADRGEHAPTTRDVVMTTLRENAAQH